MEDTECFLLRSAAFTYVKTTALMLRRSSLRSTGDFCRSKRSFRVFRRTKCTGIQNNIYGKIEFAFSIQNPEAGIYYSNCMSEEIP